MESRCYTWQTGALLVPILVYYNTHMNTRRLNITLPLAEAVRLEKVPNKSAFIAEAVREKLDAAERQKRAEALAQAYREAAKEETSLAQEWDSVAGDSL